MEKSELLSGFSQERFVVNENLLKQLKWRTNQAIRCILVGGFILGWLVFDKEIVQAQNIKKTTWIESKSNMSQENLVYLAQQRLEAVADFIQREIEKRTDGEFFSLHIPVDLMPPEYLLEEQKKVLDIAYYIHLQFNKQKWLEKRIVISNNHSSFYYATNKENRTPQQIKVSDSFGNKIVLNLKEKGDSLIENITPEVKIIEDKIPNNIKVSLEKVLGPTNIEYLDFEEFEDFHEEGSDKITKITAKVDGDIVNYRYAIDSEGYLSKKLEKRDENWYMLEEIDIDIQPDGSESKVNKKYSAIDYTDTLDSVQIVESKIKKNGESSSLTTEIKYFYDDAWERIIKIEFIQPLGGMKMINEKKLNWYDKWSALSMLKKYVGD